MDCLLGVLNNEGIMEFKSYLENARITDNATPPFDILTDNKTTIHYGENNKIHSREFINKRDLGRYLSQLLSFLPTNEIIYNKGLWSWLALFYFDQICPIINNQRKVNKYYYYILDVTEKKPDWSHYYRHMLAAPFYIYIRHLNSAYIILDQPVYLHGDYMEQLASRQEIITNQNIVKVTDLLYYDFNEKQPKKGATSKSKPGNIRRFAQNIFLQLNRTYDLYSMKPDQIIKLLPKPEFNLWL